MQQREGAGGLGAPLEEGPGVSTRGPTLTPPLVGGDCLPPKLCKQGARQKPVPSLSHKGAELKEGEKPFLHTPHMYVLTTPHAHSTHTNSHTCTHYTYTHTVGKLHVLSHTHTNTCIHTPHTFTTPHTAHNKLTDSQIHTHKYMHAHHTDTTLT